MMTVYNDNVIHTIYDIYKPLKDIPEEPSYETARLSTLKKFTLDNFQLYRAKRNKKKDMLTENEYIASFDFLVGLRKKCEESEKIVDSCCGYNSIFYFSLSTIIADFVDIELYVNGIRNNRGIKKELVARIITYLYARRQSIFSNMISISDLGTNTYIL